MRDLVIDVNHPAGADWPPAEERLRLEELPVKRGLGLFRALRAATARPRYGRVYIACKDHRHVGPWLLLAALSLSREVWVLPVTSSLHRLTKAGLFWKLPAVKRLLPRAAAREFVRTMRANPPAGAPPKTGGVLLLSHSYPPSTGGIQTSMVHAAQGLAERGVGVRVLDGYRPEWRDYDAQSPVQVRRVFNGARFRLAEYRRLARRAAEAARLLPGKPPPTAVLDFVERFIAACSPDKAAAFLSNYEAACRLIAEGEPDTIHVGYCHPDSMTAMLLAAIGGWPYLVYAHGTETRRFSEDRRLAPFFTKSLGAAAAVLANARY
ncbi:MAG TPA: hypothetical protein ENN88_00200, partial [Candidatus Coatesbacteria bacterium]|nr:hypothetical protein [Candidatus Coatesbacteria bacterium]